MGFPRQEYWSGLPCPSPRDLPNPGTESRSPTFQADSLLSEPPEKPKNTGIGCHALLQGIFPTWELNLGLPHCRWILYQLSHQGSPLGNMLLCKMYVHMHTPTYLGGGLVAKSCWLLATSWTAAHQAPQSKISQTKTLEWVAISSSRGSSRPVDWTCVSCIAGGFFTTEPPGKATTYLGITANIPTTSILIIPS